MVGVGPLIVSSDTPLKDEKNGDFTLALKVMALTRIMLPNINIPATTAMETLRENGRIIALQSGANVVMPNVVDFDLRRKYEIYPGKSSVKQESADLRKSVEDKIKSIGRYVSNDYGFRA